MVIPKDLKKLINRYSRSVSSYVVTYYDQSIKSIGIYKNKKESGLHHFWYENGNPWARANYINGEKHGVHIIWYMNGMPMEESNWLNGKRDGVYRYWTQDGILLMETNRKNDKLNGLYKIYDTQTGLLFNEKYYENDEVKSEWYEDQY